MFLRVWIEETQDLDAGTESKAVMAEEPPMSWKTCVWTTNYPNDHVRVEMSDGQQPSLLQYTDAACKMTLISYSDEQAINGKVHGPVQLFINPTKRSKTKSAAT